MTRTEQLQDRYARVMMPNYGLPPVALAYGQGSQVWDVDGRLPHAILLEIFTDSGIGTMVVPDGAGQ